MNFKDENYGQDFLRHFEYLYETEKKVYFRCLLTKDTFSSYKCTFPDKSLVCKCCAKKVLIHNNTDHPTEMYLKLVEKYIHETDAKEKLRCSKKIYYYRTKAGIPHSDFQIRKYSARIEELNEKIIYNEKIRQLSHQGKSEKGNKRKNEDYLKYRSGDSSARKLFYEIKNTLPDFTDYESYIEYRNALLEGKEVITNEKYRNPTGIN